jgi:hypothetical protein
MLLLGHKPSGMRCLYDSDDLRRFGQHDPIQNRRIVWFEDRAGNVETVLINDEEIERLKADRHWSELRLMARLVAADAGHVGWYYRPYD